MIKKNFKNQYKNKQTKTFDKLEVEGNFLNMIKGIYEIPTANTLKVKNWKLPQDQEKDTDAHFTNEERVKTGEIQNGVTSTKLLNW